MATTAEDLLSLFESDEKPKGKRIHESLDHQDQDLESALTSDADIDNLSEIVKTKEQIGEIKKHLDIIISSITENPSLINRIADTFGKLPLWQKTVTGTLVTFPPVIAGIAASMSSLLIAGGAIGVVYTASGILLQDHHDCNENINQRLRNGISSITDILEITIIALDNVRIRLSEQIARFKKENAELSCKVMTMQDHISTLSMQIGILKDTGVYLADARIRLEAQIIELQKNSEENQALLASTRRELECTIQDYHTNQEKLFNEVTELRKVRDEMSTEITKTTRVSVALQAVVTNLSSQIIEDKSQKEAFKSSIQRLEQDSQRAADNLAERLTTTQQELNDAKKALQANNEINRALLERQNTLMTQIASLNLNALGVIVKQSQSNHSFFPGLDCAEKKDSTDQLVYRTSTNGSSHK